MKKTFICSLLAVSMLTACATDPYTGKARFPKRHGERESERWPERESERWPAVKKAL